MRREGPQRGRDGIVLRAPNISIAPTGFDRWPELHALLHEAFAYMDARIDPPSSMHRLDASALAAKARVEHLFLARDGDDLLGCCFLRPERRVMYLGKLAVRGERRGAGLGRRLVGHALAFAASRDREAVELQVRIELVENQAFFASLGFERIGESAHAGYRRPTSVTMRRVCDTTR